MHRITNAYYGSFTFDKRSCCQSYKLCIIEYEHDTASDEYEHDTASDEYEHDTASDEYEHDTASDEYERQWPLFNKHPSRGMLLCFVIALFNISVHRWLTA